jgi:hypothetical protein
MCRNICARDLRLIALGLNAIFASGYGHQSEIADFGNELYGATSGMTAAIDRSPSASGVAAAYGDFRKEEESFDKKWNKLLTTKLTKQAKSDLSQTAFASQGAITSCFERHTAEFRNSEEFFQAMGRLRTDFDATFRLEDAYNMK